MTRSGGIDINNLRYRTWAEVSPDNVEYNYRIVRSRVPSTTKVCCVLKADAYGHGAKQISKQLSRAGADFFAVATVEEAVELRTYGITTPVLILGYTPPEQARTLSELNISQCVYSYEYAKLLAEHANRENVKIAIHVKIDTGMGRLGFVFRHGDEDILTELKEICSYDCFIKEGIFTHFPTADGGASTKKTTERQYELFCIAVSMLKTAGITFNIKHCANSAAILDYPEFSLDMVRAGIFLYGAMPSDDIVSDIRPKSTFTLKSVVSNVKTLRAGDAVGYGSEFAAEKDIRVATVAIGYADGFSRANADSGTHVFLNGKLCRVIGRVCMDQLMINADEAENVHVGDEVIIFGEGSPIGLKEYSELNKTVPYEILCGIGKRVPRFYK